MVFKQKSNKLRIEIQDQNINRKLCKLIIHIEKHIIALKDILEKGVLGDKEAQLKDLLTAFLRTHRDLELISLDLVKITNQEAQEKDYIRLNDQGWLTDKSIQVRKMKRILGDLIEMLEIRPTDQELEKDLLDKMTEDVKDVVDAMNSIITDDKELEKIYKKTV